MARARTTPVLPLSSKARPRPDRPAAPPAVDTLSSAQLARRDRIVETASALLEQHAYDDIQMRDVAEHAEVALGTVYRYFASKEHLFACVLLSWAASMGAGISRSPLRGASVAEQLQDVYGRAIAAFERRPEFYRLFVVVESTTDPFARALHAEFVTATSGQMRAPLARLDPADADAVAQVIGSVLATSLRTWALGQMTIAAVRANVSTAIRLVFSDPPQSS